MLNIRTPFAQLVVTYLTNIIKHEVKEYNMIVSSFKSNRDVSINTLKKYKQNVECFKKSATVFKNGIFKDYLASLNNQEDVSLNKFVEEFQGMYLTFLKVESIEMSLRYFKAGRLDDMLCNLSKPVSADCIGKAYEIMYSDKGEYEESSAKPFIAAYGAYLVLLHKYNARINFENTVDAFIHNIKLGFNIKCTDKFSLIFIISILIKELACEFDFDKALDYVHKCAQGQNPGKEYISKGEIEELGQIQKVYEQPTTAINDVNVSLQEPTSMSLDQSQTANSDIFNKKNVTNITINRKPDRRNPENDDRYSALVKNKSYNDSIFKG